MIYLDYAASSKVEDEVLDTFININKKYYANPNSNHKLGMEVKKVIDDCTRSIANKLNVKPEEIIYTSGASESNNLAIKGVCERYKCYGKHLLISSLEHNSIVASASVMQELGFEVELIPVDKNGLVDIENLKKLVRDDTILVSICSVDSELGIVQPIEEIGTFLKNYPNLIFHTDATAAISKVNIDYKDVDLITVAPHKFGGLLSTGILIKREKVSLKPQINGGRSTTVFRSGTPDVASIASIEKALFISLSNMEKRQNYIKKLSDKIKNELKKYDNIYINNREDSIPNVINFSIKNVKALDMQKFLEDEGIYVSTKISCSPISTPSKLVYALTKDKSLALSSIRISLSYLTKEEEVNQFLNTFNKIMERFK